MISFKRIFGKIFVCNNTAIYKILKFKRIFEKNVKNLKKFKNFQKCGKSQIESKILQFLCKCGKMATLHMGFHEKNIRSFSEEIIAERAAPILYNIMEKIFQKFYGERLFQ